MYCSPGMARTSLLKNAWAHSPCTVPENTSLLRHILLLFLRHERRSYKKTKMFVTFNREKKKKKGKIHFLP